MQTLVQDDVSPGSSSGLEEVQHDFEGDPDAKGCRRHPCQHSASWIVFLSGAILVVVGVILVGVGAI